MCVCVCVCVCAWYLETVKDTGRKDEKDVAAAVFIFTVNIMPLLSRIPFWKQNTATVPITEHKPPLSGAQESTLSFSTAPSSSSSISLTVGHPKAFYISF